MKHVIYFRLVSNDTQNDRAKKRLVSLIDTFQCVPLAIDNRLHQLIVRCLRRLIDILLNYHNQILMDSFKMKIGAHHG